MANPVYHMVCDAFTHFVSRRAAENLVRTALHDAGSDPDRVTAREMQELLRTSIFRRLQLIIPLDQAKGQIRSLLQELESTLASPARPPLSEQAQRSLEELRQAVAQAQLPPHPDVDRLLHDLEQVPQTAEPERVIGALWDDFILISGRLTSPDTPEPEAAAPLSEDAPGLPEKDPGGLLLEELFEFEPELPELPELLEPPETPSPTSPPAPARLQVSARPRADLGAPEVRDLILSRFALEEGVTGVLLSTKTGQVLGARTRSKAEELASLSAATTLLIGQKPFRVFYADLESHLVCIAPLHGNVLLTVVAGPTTNVGRLLSEIQNIKEEI
ncbi:hypothetical protein HNR42_001766 [Deinobacterium chartae]|uniref:Roadblock/LAMTOR2 domain-containing protein n=1 Tax=Deinobacterium chartae TaxID=521158 RepID=A0A841HXS6_9DEIO|nr:hypothetical protein [Deinobacterium chartae]MBB6098341.1 hypothetical protein [Deinobacterium chartae]